MKRANHFSGRIKETHPRFVWVAFILFTTFSGMMVTSFAVESRPTWFAITGIVGFLVITAMGMSWPRITELMARRALFRIQRNLDRCVEAEPYVVAAGGMVPFMAKYADVDAIFHNIRLSNPDDNGGWLESSRTHFSYIEFPTEDAHVLFRLMS